MAKKVKKVETVEDIFKTMYPDLPTSDDDEIVDDNKPKNGDRAAEIAALQAQIAKLEGKLDSVGSPVPVTTKQPLPPTPPTFLAPPDPIEDPKAYAAYLDEKLQKTIEYEKAKLAFENEMHRTSAGRNTALWNNFESKYTDYAKDGERVEIAATRVIQRLKAQGVDIDQYMYGTQDRFMTDVTKEFDKLFGAPKSDTSVEEVEEDEDDDDDIRTSVPGGGVSSGRQQSARKQPVNPLGEIGSEIAAWQTKMGLRYS